MPETARARRAVAATQSAPLVGAPLVAGLLLAGLLAGCGGAPGDPGGQATSDAPSASVSPSPGADTSATEPSPGADTPATEPSPSDGGATAAPVGTLRARLMAFSRDYNEARFACFADPRRCQDRFDSTLGRHVFGTAEQQLRSGLAEAVAQGVRVRNTDEESFFFQGLRAFKRDPVDAALVLCVVDKGVRYIPASGGRAEQIVDDSQVTYSMVLRLQEDARGDLRVARIGNTPFEPLVGAYGDCAPYAR